MFKIPGITLFLFLNTSAHTQDFNLTDKGLKQIQIGDTINLATQEYIKPVTGRLDFLQIRFRSTEYFDYYYIDHTVRAITLDSAIVVKDIFIYSEKIKLNETGGIILFVDKKYDSLLVALFNQVFGPQQAETSSGAGDIKWRIRKYWTKEQINAIITHNYTELLEVDIRPNHSDVRFPGLKFRN